MPPKTSGPKVTAKKAGAKRGARGRNTNSGRVPFNNVKLPLRLERKRDTPSAQRAPVPTEYSVTKAVLNSLVHHEAAGREFEYQEMGFDLQLITQREDQDMALQIYDRQKNCVATICAGKANIRLDVYLYQDKFCIDLAEVVGNKWTKRWSFFLMVNTRLQVENARTLWNHLCSTFQWMPQRILRSIDEGQPASPPYGFRRSTIQQRRERAGQVAGGGWTIELSPPYRSRTFGGFFAQHLAKVKRYEYGLGDKSRQDDEDGHDLAWDQEKVRKGGAKTRRRGRPKGRKNR